MHSFLSRQLTRTSQNVSAKISLRNQRDISLASWAMMTRRFRSSAQQNNNVYLSALGGLSNEPAGRGRGWKFVCPKEDSRGSQKRVRATVQVPIDNTRQLKYLAYRRNHITNNRVKISPRLNRGPQARGPNCNSLCSIGQLGRKRSDRSTSQRATQRSCGCGAMAQGL